MGVLEIKNFRVIVEIGDQKTDLCVSAETNYDGGEPILLANLVYRAMLACGYTVPVVADALGGVATSAGYQP